RGVNQTPSQDQYFKGALFLNTLRSVVDNDARWWKLTRDYCERFKYSNIMTEDVVKFFNEQTRMNLTPIFDQYLRQAALPALELRFQESDGSVSYRWKADVKEFAMPVKVGRRADWRTIQPATEWKTLKTGVKKEEFEVATDLYYVDVIKN
ncbi:MAG: M1 family metallopeptidase, partial [Blastocatellia bacterium]